MSGPKISVVIPTYNAAHLVVDAIDSVLAQTAPADEIIVIDDGSADNTSAALARYGDRLRYIVQKNAGASSARNHGVQLAQGDYVAFLDADDVWHPRRLEFQLKAIAKHPDLGLLGCKVFEWPADRMPKVNEAEAETVVFVPWDQLVLKTCIATTSSIVRKSIVDQLGGFDTSLKSTEDRDLWVRIAELAPVAYLPAELVGMRKIEGSLSRQKATQIRDNMLKMLSKVDDRGVWKNRPLLRRKSIAYAYLSTAYLDHLAGNHLESLKNMIKSVIIYPLPFKRGEVRTPWTRPKSIALYFLRMLGLAPPEQQVFSGKLNTNSGSSEPAALAASGTVPVEAPTGVH